VPMTTVTFSTLPARQRPEGTGLYNLSRNIGSAVGISLMVALISQNVQANHEEIGAYVTPYNRNLQHPSVAKTLDPTTLPGRAALDDLVTEQATIIAYMNDFKLMMILCIAVMPMLLLLRTPPRAGSAAPDHAVAIE